jgi:hypothetical protein
MGESVPLGRERRNVGLVRRRGLEPLCLAALAPQASASANFATSAGSLTRVWSGRGDVQSRGEYTITGAWFRALEVAEEVCEGAQFEEMLAGGRGVDGLVFEDPGEVVGDEDGVEAGGQRGVDVGLG